MVLFPRSSTQPKDWSIKMNKKERRLALATALQSAAADITVVDNLTVEDKKTKSLLATLNKVCHKIEDTGFA